MEGNKVLELGFYDDPRKQEQNVYSIDLLNSNVIIFGTAMSGKSTALKTLLVRLHENVTSHDKEHIYVLDFFGSLNAYSELPFVIACFDNSNEENIRRLFKKVEKSFENNKKQLKGSSYSKVKEDERPPHITLMIDGLNAFLAEDRFIAYHEMLLRFSREGLPKGLSIVVTATETSGGVVRYLSAFGTKIAFDMPSDKYAEIFGARTDKPMALPGRGIINKGIFTLEFQCFLPFRPEIEDDASKLGKALGELAEQTKKMCVYANNVDKIPIFSENLRKGDIIKFYQGEDLRDEQYEVTIGLDYYSFKPIKLTLPVNSFAQTIAIYGKKEFGKTNLLSLILQAANCVNYGYIRFVLWDDHRGSLKCFYGEYHDGDDNSMPQSKHLKTLNPNAEVVECFNRVEFRKYITEKGYYDLSPKRTETPSTGRTGLPDISKSETSSFVESDSNPFTVFVIQDKSCYPGGMISLLAPVIQHIHNALFIFSDVKGTLDPAVVATFNEIVDYAFLLDDIASFVSGKGAKSVFKDMEIKELKESYGKCEIGDGYYYDNKMEDLHKLKIIKDCSD